MLESWGEPSQNVELDKGVGIGAYEEYKENNVPIFHP